VQNEVQKEEVMPPIIPLLQKDAALREASI
jgi:hypothetical protein